MIVNLDLEVANPKIRLPMNRGGQIGENVAKIRVKGSELKGYDQLFNGKVSSTISDERMRIGCATVLFIILLLITMCAVERQSLDPLEKAVSQALGNNNLVLGSKLELWIETLGEPDITFPYRYYKGGGGSYVGWFKHGVAVTTFMCNVDEGEQKSLKGSEAHSIIIPVKERVHNRYPTMDKNYSVIEFDKLLDVRVKGKRLSEMTFEEIDSLYHFHYDSSEYSIFLHKLPEYITRVEVGIQYSKNFSERLKDPDYNMGIEQITVYEISPCLFE